MHYIVIHIWDISNRRLFQDHGARKAQQQTGILRAWTVRPSLWIFPQAPYRNIFIFNAGRDPSDIVGYYLIQAAQ